MSARWIAADWPAPSNVVAGTVLRDGQWSDLTLSAVPCWLTQVHGATVVEAESAVAAPEADASVARSAENACVIRSADCLPVLFSANDGREVAAAHAGWRGLAAGVLENTVTTMNTAPRDLIAWLGPAISQESFEVGDEVRAAFVTSDPAAASCFEQNGRGRWQCDLYALARQRLGAAGVSAVYGGGFCTYLDEARFFSYRRNPDCGRLVSFVSLSAP